MPISTVKMKGKRNKRGNGTTNTFSLPQHPWTPVILPAVLISTKNSVVFLKKKNVSWENTFHHIRLYTFAKVNTWVGWGRIGVDKIWHFPTRPFTQVSVVSGWPSLEARVSAVPWSRYMYVVKTRLQDILDAQKNESQMKEAAETDDKTYIKYVCAVH